MLENSSYPFAAKILEAIRNNEQQAAEGAPMQGVPEELLAQMQQGGVLPRGGNASAVQDAVNEKPAQGSEEVVSGETL